MKYTKKTNFTQQQLQEAIIELLEQEPFEKITINQIVNYCHLNRSTFYRYYEDKYALLQSVEEGLIAQFNERHPIEITIRRINETILQESQLMEGIDYFKDNYHQLHALLGPNCDRSFENRLRKYFNRRYQVIVNGIDNHQVELVQRMIVSMIIEGLKYWLFTPQITIEDLVQGLRAILLKGPIAYLQSLRH